MRISAADGPLLVLLTKVIKKLSHRVELFAFGKSGSVVAVHDVHVVVFATVEP